MPNVLPPFLVDHDQTPKPNPSPSIDPIGPHKQPVFVMWISMCPWIVVDK